MSVLLIGISGATGRALIRRLVSESDQVRVIEDDLEAAEEWASLGAHVARGSPVDADLVERAATNVRTVVVMGRARGPHPVLAHVVEGLQATPRADEGIRVVVVSGSVSPAGIDLLSRSGLDYVVLIRPKRANPLRARISAEALANAIDAADDLPGSPRLQLDLGKTASWAALRLAPPTGFGEIRDLFGGPV